jgi:F-type H+-transporting ATPase subunit c
MESWKNRALAFASAFVATLGTASTALAEEQGGAGSEAGLIALAAGIAVAGAGFGAAFGQGRAVAAAMESIGRNPNSADRIQTPMIIGIAFIEALAIYALVIAFFLQGKI